MQSSSVVAPDGSPVAVYRHLPEGNAAELIDAAIPPRSRVLDLGCGVGRIAKGLARRGHAVVGVDNEPSMIRELPAGVRGVVADIADVRLGRTFGVVLLAGHFLNDADGTSAFLSTARAHLGPGGLLLAEVYPPGLDWRGQVGRPRSFGDVEVVVARATVTERILDAEIVYRVGDDEWRQPFVARLRDERELAAELARDGFRWGRWLDPAWFVARLD
jgi:SAM-dependent methyltransferase